MSWASKAIKKVKKSVKKVVSGSGLMGALTGGLAGGLLGGPAGALAGAGLGFMSGAGQDAANEANQEAVDAANQANIQLWREQAAYNTPANQVARLRAAGLNPNLFYSQGDTGNMSSAPTMKAAQYDYNYAEAVDKMAVYYQMRNLAAQNANLKAQTDNINAQTAARVAQTKLDVSTLDFYNKHGYFPNASIPSQILEEIKSAPFIKNSAEALGSAVGSAVGKLSRRYERVDFSPEALGREKARRMAEKGFVYDGNRREWVKW